MGLKEAVARVFGREFEDDAEAVASVAELRQQTGDLESLRSQLATMQGQVEELTAQLAAKEDRIAELEAEAEQSEVESVVAAALSEGRISPAQEGWAKTYADDDLDGFRTYLETVKAIDSADTTSLASHSLGEHAEIEAYAKENKVPYHEAALAVKKQHQAAGKGE